MVIQPQHCKGEEVLGHRSGPCCSHFIPTISLRRRYDPSYSDFYWYFYFTGDETKAQRAHVTCPKSPVHTWQDIQYLCPSEAYFIFRETDNKQIYQWIHNKFPDENKYCAENKTPKRIKSNWERVLSAMVQEDLSEKVTQKHRALEHDEKRPAMRGSGQRAF